MVRRIPGFSVRVWMGVFLWTVPLLAAEPSPHVSVTSIDSFVAFTALDGGVLDEDGVADGVLTLSSLELSGGGAIVIDVPQAEFAVRGSVTLRGHAAIRIPFGAVPSVGPEVLIRSGGMVSIRGTSRISLYGRLDGGRLILCAAGGIEIGGDARVAVDGVGDEKTDADHHPEDPPVQTRGGDVWLESAGRMSLGDSARISANGSDGGTVRIHTCDPSPTAIEIEGRIAARGWTGVGGMVELQARQGGIWLDGDEHSEHPATILATGSSADGDVTLAAATTVVPSPAPTSPSATVVENAPSSARCDSCFSGPPADPADCDSDGIPNSQEIAQCDGDPSCDDCNLNGVPDGCDIASGESVDVDPADGVPDDCFGFVAGGCSPPSDRWSCFDNWVLPGDQYPDDLSSAPGVHVTLGPGDFALLDVDAMVPTLRLLRGAMLRITQSGPNGDLGFSLPAKVLNLGAILVSGDRTIGSEFGVPPLFTIGPDGLYARDPIANRSSAGAETTTDLAVSDLILLPGSCTSPVSSGASLQLDESMSLHAVRDIYLRGASVAACDVAEAFTARGGVSPPPKLNTSGSSSVGTGAITLARDDSNAPRLASPAGSLHLEQIVEVSIRSSVPMVLRGDFDNRSIAPDLFDWLFGAMTMAGTEPQTFEVAGRDVGPTFLGAFLDANSNFAMGKVSVSAGSDVTFTNAFANTVGAGACEEALYLREFVLEPGAHVTLDNCRIYYALGTPSPADVSLVGCGALVQLVPTPPRVGDDICVGGTNAGGACGQHADCPGGYCLLKNRFASFVPAFPPAGGAFPMGIKVTAIDLAPGSVSAPADFLGRSWWVQSPTLGIADGVSPAFNAASLGCSFVASDLGDIPLLHTYGSPIVPASSYEVRLCTTDAGPCSPALRVDTGVWGDVAVPLVVGQPSFQDIVAVVNKFLGNPSGPSKTRTKLAGRSPDPLTDVTFLEISAAADAFRGRSFATMFSLGPASCP